MSTFRKCSYYRASEIKCCDLDGNQTTCNGDLNSCEDLKFSEKSDEAMQSLQGKLDEFK